MWPLRQLVIQGAVLGQMHANFNRLYSVHFSYNFANNHRWDQPYNGLIQISCDFGYHGIREYYPSRHKLPTDTNAMVYKLQGQKGNS